MKAKLGSDEWCRAMLLHYGLWSHDHPSLVDGGVQMLRAAVDEARREEREACAAIFDGERAAAWFHDIYQREAHRRGDIRHPDSYDELSEMTKEWDRVLVRAAKAAILARSEVPRG